MHAPPTAAGPGALARRGTCTHAGTPCQKVRSRRRAGGPSCQAARHPSSVPRACLLPVTQPSDRPAASLPRPVQASAWESLRSRRSTSTPSRTLGQPDERVLLPRPQHCPLNRRAPPPADTRLRDCQAQLSCCRAAPPSMRSGERRGADLLSRFPAGSRLPPPVPRSLLPLLSRSLHACLINPQILVIL